MPPDVRGQTSIPTSSDTVPLNAKAKGINKLAKKSAYRHFNT